jgi:hypothetical protein
MSLALTVACLTLVLTGCAIVKEREQPTPYTLTNSEIEAIVTGIRSARKDLDDPSYRNFRAVSHPDGQIDVCSWFRPQRDSEESPFIGTLFAGQFVLQQFGGDPFQDGKVISDCRNRGFEL